MKITKIIEIIEFQTIIMKTMKILEFHARITKIMKNLRDPRKNNENHVTLIIQPENYKKKLKSQNSKRES